MLRKSSRHYFFPFQFLDKKSILVELFSEFARRSCALTHIVVADGVVFSVVVVVLVVVVVDVFAVVVVFVGCGYSTTGPRGK